MSDTVLVERDRGVARVVLNRPDRTNSLTTELMEALPKRLKEVADDPDVRVVVLTGAGKRAFSAGADLAPPSGGAGGQSAPQTLEDSIDQLQGFQESSWLLHTMSIHSQRKQVAHTREHIVRIQHRVSAYFRQPLGTVSQDVGLRPHQNAHVAVERTESADRTRTVHAHGIAAIFSGHERHGQERL